MKAQRPYPRYTVTAKAEAAILRGHPWVYDAEIEEEIKRQAESMGRDVEDFKKGLTDSQKDYLKENAEIRKALKIMRESAKVSEPKAEEPATEADKAEKTEE